MVSRLSWLVPSTLATTTDNTTPPTAPAAPPTAPHADRHGGCTPKGPTPASGGGRALRVRISAGLGQTAAGVCQSRPSVAVILAKIVAGSLPSRVRAARTESLRTAWALASQSTSCMPLPGW